MHVLTFSKKFSWEIENNNNSVYKPITDMYRYRPIIGFADMGKSLSVSADTECHIGSPTDILIRTKVR